MRDVACSSEIEGYFSRLEAEVERAYGVAEAARAKGFDPEVVVEIPRAEDLASRVERVLQGFGVDGVAQRIREVAREHDREETALIIAKEMAARPSKTRDEALERAVRVGLAILTEGILVAPLEGVTSARVKKGAGGTYAEVYFSGPIRSAGGTGQALSVLIADVVRRELDVGTYEAPRDVVARFTEEIPLYKRSQHLQYTPSREEITRAVAHCPVSINGEGTETEEISGHRDLTGIRTNRVRGGACLVVAEGLCLKAAKLMKHVRRLGIDGWDFLDDLIIARRGEVEEGVGPSDKFIENIVAGRPVLAHPSRKGGFRLRYGRTRATGLAAVAIHPATMRVVDEFIAVGTQLKVEAPGKAAAATPCDSLDGPIVLLRNGDLVALQTEEDAARVAGEVKRVVDLGEILVPYGEFLENAHPLLPGAYSVEWYGLELDAAAGGLPEGWRDPGFDEAMETSREYGVPMHPKFNLFWHDVSVDDLEALRGALAASGKAGDAVAVLPFDERIKEILMSLGALHRQTDGGVVLEPWVWRVLWTFLGVGGEDVGDADDPLEYVSRHSGVRVRARAATRIGARMGRPEKAKERKMRPPPHALFPVGQEGGPQRLVKEAAGHGSAVVEVGIRTCTACGKRWFLPMCTCGGHTEARGSPRQMPIAVNDVLRAAAKAVGISRVPNVKGVRGMISSGRTPEVLEKGILRARHGVFVFKDGTVRFDMTNLPLTHFCPDEVGLSVERAKELGYSTDARGEPLTDGGQLVELRPQDVILSRRAGSYLVDVSHFVDDLLAKVYGLDPFYGAESEEDLLGQCVVTLAPHTSGGVLGRIIGFTEARASFNHPLLIAGRRRNADGDEDCVILLLDALLNFSRSFLPEKRGGLMDAPLVLTTRLDPAEVDKEAHNIDVSPSYPLELYEAAAEYAHPKRVESLIDTIGKRLGSVLQYEEMAFTHEVSRIDMGPLVSAYKSGSMLEKMEGQLELALKIRAVDAVDVVTRVVNHHFLPDLIGNLRSFSTQKVRCTKCNAKYRRMPLSGKCRSPTNGGKTVCDGNLTLTVHENSVKKYLEVSKRIAQEYDISHYVQQRLDLIDEAIESVFTSDKVHDLKLDDFL